MTLSPGGHVGVLAAELEMEECLVISGTSPGQLSADSLFKNQSHFNGSTCLKKM
jgi:hypothetical protein